MAISLFISYFFSVVRTFSNAIILCQSPCLANKWHFGLFPSTAVSMLKVDVFFAKLRRLLVMKREKIRYLDILLGHHTTKRSKAGENKVAINCQ